MGLIAQRRANSHDNEGGGDNNGLEATTENRVGDDGQRFIRDHVCKKERDEEQMPVLPNGDDLLGVFALLTVGSIASAVTAQEEQQDERNGVPETLRTCSCVSSSDM
jgi:hypothetical protein